MVYQLQDHFKKNGFIVITKGRTVYLRKYGLETSFSFTLFKANDKNGRPMFALQTNAEDFTSETPVKDYFYIRGHGWIKKIKIDHCHYDEECQTLVPKYQQTWLSKFFPFIYGQKYKVVETTGEFEKWFVTLVFKSFSKLRKEIQDHSASNK